jgi:periplasmic divalent cation tolerance protein
MEPAGEAATGRQPEDALVVLVTVPSSEVGERLARGLLERRLVACVNLLPGVVSLYRWQGAVQRDGEVLALCKTTRARWHEFETYLAAEHPYEVPELLALRAEQVSGSYLGWLRGAVEAELSGP